jgi:hypothetical protein
MARRKIIEDRVILNTYISKTEKDKFDLLAQSEGLSSSHVMRTLVQQYIREREGK